MRSIAVRLCAVAAAGVLLIGGCADDNPEDTARPFRAAWDGGRGAVTEQTDVPATMRDGTVLRADVYRPDTPTRCR